MRMRPCFVRKTKQFVSLLFISCLAVMLVSCQAAQKMRVSPDEQNSILSAAEKPFIHMNEKRYRDVWEGISRKSKDAIVRDVLKACNVFHVTCDSATKFHEDFANAGPSAIVYWENYLAAFDPNSLIKESRWVMGKVGDEEADIVVRFRGSNGDAVLKVVKENGVWKMGLEESFGVRKWMPW